MPAEPRKIALDVPGTPATPPHRMVYYEWGNPQASQVVVCVHGLTRNGRDFDFVADALANDFRVISPDICGRGKSDWLTDAKLYNYGTYVAECMGFLNALQLPKVHWVGTSMGGIIGMMLLPAMPGRIASLTLNDIGCLVPAAGLARISAYAGASTIFTTHEEAEAALRKNCATFGITEEAHWHHLFAHSIQPAPENKWRLAYDPLIAATLPKKEDIKDVNLWPYWEAMKIIPLLLIRGADSDILTRETADQMRAQHSRLTFHEVPGCGHAPALMNDKETALIHGWISAAVIS